jgi:hypothetical protein
MPALKKSHCKNGHPRTPENLRGRSCKQCLADGQRARCAADPETHNKRSRTWRLNNPDKAKLESLRTNRKKYGLTPESYDAKLASQNNLCALCHEPFEAALRSGRDPVLDHDHNTNALREFVHRTCNSAIGNLKDDPKLCRLAAEYLERHSNTREQRSREAPGVRPAHALD